MVDFLSRIVLDMGVQKASMTPKATSSNLILQLVVVDTMQGNLEEPNNHPKGYHEFVSDHKLYHPIVARYALDL